MGQDGAGVDQIKLGIECRGRLERIARQEQKETRVDNKRGLEQDSKRGVQGRVGKQESGAGETRSVQGEVRARYKVERKHKSGTSKAGSGQGWEGTR
ncbi:hypothetical protein XELAEV_18008233mg [Xenopus laevis]|uniref:Uncharacterized protein n=1 Tax=Xenopus laevis TaxID=8355 RepID=A0A974I5X0_XENLA|nr:hypothetical protein XELAEV_18008233mg [Xenopus laevis]